MKNQNSLLGDEEFKVFSAPIHRSWEGISTDSECSVVDGSLKEDAFYIEPIPRLLLLTVSLLSKISVLFMEKNVQVVHLCFRRWMMFSLCWNLPLLNFLTCCFQNWISKSTTVCLSRKELHLSSVWLLKQDIFYLHFSPGCLTFQCKHTCRRAYAVVLRGSSPPVQKGTERPLGSCTSCGHLLPGLHWTELKTVRERSAWGVQELALILR